MTGKTAPRIIKKIGDSHVVWFGESNRWLEFREPAWFVYHKHEAGENEKSLVVQLSERYSLPVAEARRFYREILEGIRISSVPGPVNDPVPSRVADNIEFDDLRFRSRHYIINGKPVTISYGSQELEHYIHRPLAWLESGNATGGSLPETGNLPGGSLPQTENLPGGSGNFPGGSLRLRVGKNIQAHFPGREKQYFLYEDDKTEYLFDDAGAMKHRLYVIITSYIYDIAANDWMSYIHASAVANGSQAILLSSASGSGKSTMAAMLQLSPDENGMPRPGSHDLTPTDTDTLTLPGGDLYFVSDDFVPIDSTSLKAHVFPAALTIKKGSFPVIEKYYHTGDDADSDYERHKNADLRYLRPVLPSYEKYEPSEVKKIVFIRYNPQVSFKIEKLPVIKALTLFHEEAWVSHNPGHVRKFVDWFVTLSCYRIEYSELSPALKAIRGLFEID
jgi:hypothetical protein